MLVAAIGAAAGGPGAGLLHWVQVLVGNVFLAALGVGGIALLVRRKFVRVVEFAVVGVAVGTFVYAPQVYVSLARQAAAAFGIVT